MPPKFRKRDKLLLRILAELGGLEIREGTITSGDPEEHVMGLQEGRKIWVDPAYQTVSTLVHEVLHAVYPKWTEEYVRSRESYIMNRLTHEECQALYRIYREKARPTARAKKA